MWGVSDITEVESRCADCRRVLPVGDTVWLTAKWGSLGRPVCLTCYGRRATIADGLRDDRRDRYA